MKHIRESKDLGWLSAPAFIIIVLLLVFHASQPAKNSFKVAAEKIPVTGSSPAVYLSAAE